MLRLGMESSSCCGALAITISLGHHLITHLVTSSAARNRVENHDCCHTVQLPGNAIATNMNSRVASASDLAFLNQPYHPIYSPFAAKPVLVHQ
jgi:hypothetical protein